jgi:hypothetical protein
MAAAPRRDKRAPAEDRQSRLAAFRAEIVPRLKGQQELRRRLADAPEGSYSEFAMRQLLAASDAVIIGLIDECDRLSRRPSAERPRASARKPRASAKRSHAKSKRRRGRP